MRAPRRKVVSRETKWKEANGMEIEFSYEVLECGHKVYVPRDADFAEYRYCKRCLMKAKKPSQ